MSTLGRLAVLVAERDGDWSGWVDPLRGDSDDVVVILQRRGESPGELAMRVRERVQELRRTAEISAAALVGGACWDTATLSARALVIRAIANEMVPAGGGRIFLDGGARGRGRHAMAALAAVVEDQVAQTGVDVVTATVATQPRLPAFDVPQLEQIELETQRRAA